MLSLEQVLYTSHYLQLCLHVPTPASLPSAPAGASTAADFVSAMFEAPSLHQGLGCEHIDPQCEVPSWQRGQLDPLTGVIDQSACSGLNKHNVMQYDSYLTEKHMYHTSYI